MLFTVVGGGAARGGLFRVLVVELGQSLEQGADFIHLMRLPLVQVLLSLQCSQYFFQDAKVFHDFLFTTDKAD